MLSPMPEVIPRNVCMMGGVPYEWLKKNQPFIILDESYSGTVAKVKVAYEGFENDEFISIAIPQFKVKFSDSKIIRKPLYTRPRYLLLRHSKGLELKTKPIIKVLPTSIFNDERPQFITYDQCTEQERVFVDRDKREVEFRNSLLGKIYYAATNILSCIQNPWMLTDISFY